MSNWLWITVIDAEAVAVSHISYAESVVVNHGVLFCAIGCESWWVMLSQWLWILVSYAEPVVVNHIVLYWANGYESWCVMLSHWLWIMVYYSEPVVVNVGVLCWAIGYEAWCVMLSQWLWFMVCYSEQVVVKLWSASGCVSRCILQESVVVNHVVLCWASCYESWWVTPS
jgi:hypothetical protein